MTQQDLLGTTEYAILTDSGCDLSAERLSQLGVACVELAVVGEPDNRCVMPPTPEELAETYRKLAAEGARAVLSLHSSSVLSRAVEAARAAAELADVPVEVVDTGCVSVALGLVVEGVAACRERGFSLGQAREQAIVLSEATHTVFIPTPGALPQAKRGLGVRAGFRARAEALRVRLAGERRLLSIGHGSLPKELDRSASLSDLAGKAVRTMSLSSHEAGPVCYLVLNAGSKGLLHLLEKSLDTNEFEYRRLGVTNAGPATLASAGEGSVALAWAPLSVFDGAPQRG